MLITQTIDPIAETDDDLKAALQAAFLPALLPALAHATGDLSLLRDNLRPGALAPGMEQGGMNALQQQEARDLCLGALRKLRDGQADPDADHESRVRAVLAWMTGEKATDEYIPMLIEELEGAERDTRAPDWRMPAGVDFSAVVIGAGMSGILAAIRLKQAGVPCTIIEKNADFGGTWFENTYPGARVDVSNAFYSYSFAQKNDWPKYFSPQGLLLDYFRSVADEHDIRGSVRFSTEVITATFDEERAIWSLRLRTADGSEETIETNALICATGQLNRPNMPKIEGRESFAGPSFHSAQWDHSVDLRGKRVAVIGTGASAAQFVPLIAHEVAQLDVYQRTPNWFMPVPTYHDDVPEGLRYLFTHVPHYAQWYRFYMFWNTTDGLLSMATVNDEWPQDGRAVSAENDFLRAMLTGYLQSQFTDRPDLWDKVLPQYPPAAKRMILDNGVWAATMKRENVALITDPIARITPSAVVTSDGTERPADVIIYGTGFRASQFVAPMEVIGRGGVTLAERWKGDARAYKGVVVPGFPNFFMMYGPNTNIVVNGSIIFFSECEMQYILACLRMLFTQEQRAFDCREDVHDAYNERIDALNRKRAWGASNVNAWYKNEFGRVSQNWPGNLIEYWQQTRTADPADFEFL